MKKIIAIVLTFIMVLSVTGLSFGAASTTFKNKNEIYGVWTFDTYPGSILEITAKKATLYSREYATSNFVKIVDTDTKTAVLTKDKKKIELQIYEDAMHYFKKDAKGNLLIAATDGGGDRLDVLYLTATKHKSVKEAGLFLLKDKKITTLIAGEKQTQKDIKAKEAKNAAAEVEKTKITLENLNGQWVSEDGTQKITIEKLEGGPNNFSFYATDSTKDSTHTIPKIGGFVLDFKPSTETTTTISFHEDGMSDNMAILVFSGKEVILSENSWTNLFEFDFKTPLQLAK